jgi:hypothetical protein
MRGEVLYGEAMLPPPSAQMFNLQSAHGEEKTLMHTQRTGKRLTSEGAGRSWTPRSPGARGEHHLSVARTRPASRSRPQGGSASRKP